MDSFLKKVSKDIEDKFDGQTSGFRGQVSVSISPQHILPLCEQLKNTHLFEQLADITAVDYWPQRTPRFHIVYQFNSHSHNQRLEVRVLLDGDQPELDTVEEVYPSANWQERELWDMFGIRIKGHSDLRRILMPYDWEGHPLRKDYPLGYEEVQFSFNYEEIQKRKPKVEK